MKKYMTYVLIVFSSIGCSSDDFLDGKSYLSWVKDPDNHLNLQKEISGTVYKVQYKPYDFIILNEEKSYEISKEVLEKRKQELDGMIYYNVRIATNDNKDILIKGVTDKSYYLQRLNYLSYDFQNDIKLLANSDSVNCGLFHFVQGHGVVPYVDMVLGFPIQEKTIDQTLVINDQVFGNGIIKFHIDKKNIENIPQLITI